MRAPIAWSLELGIDALRSSAPLLSRIPAGTRIYLPALIDDPPSAIEEALGLLTRENSGLVPVPHIAASREVSVASLESRMAAWQRVSSDRVREVLVVHGDREAHQHGAATSTKAAATGGPFRTSLELLETGALQRCGVELVHLCGHPEGIAAAGLSAEAAKAHLRTLILTLTLTLTRTLTLTLTLNLTLTLTLTRTLSLTKAHLRTKLTPTPTPPPTPTPTLPLTLTRTLTKAHLKAKLEWAAASGVRASVATQFCFDSATTTSYVDLLRADGLTVDVSLLPCLTSQGEGVARSRRCA